MWLMDSFVEFLRAKFWCHQSQNDYSGLNKITEHSARRQCQKLTKPIINSFVSLFFYTTTRVCFSIKLVQLFVRENGFRVINDHISIPDHLLRKIYILYVQRLCLVNGCLAFYVVTALVYTVHTVQYNKLVERRKLSNWRTSSTFEWCKFHGHAKSKKYLLGKYICTYIYIFKMENTWKAIPFIR